jgi:hypothetical protein
MKLRNLIIAAAGCALAAGVGGAASAATPWQAHHPRRVEVNHRLNQLRRDVRFDRRTDRISPAKAHRLDARLHEIRMQERGMAARHDSHITRLEQARLNHEETSVRTRLPS